MNLDSLVPIMLTIIGALLAALSVALVKGNTVPAPTPEHPRRTLSAPKLILCVFVVLVLLFGGVTLYQYFPVLMQNRASSLFTIWLFLTMVGGMFVQVLTTNYRLGKPMLEISGPQLLLPLLFSVFVFYPIWAMATSGTRNFFVIHAAFLNGFFWESVVSATKRPSSTPVMNADG